MELPKASKLTHLRPIVFAIRGFIASRVLEEKLGSSIEHPTLSEPRGVAENPVVFRIQVRPWHRLSRPTRVYAITRGAGLITPHEFSRIFGVGLLPRA